MDPHSQNRLSNIELQALSRQSNILIARYYLKTKVVESLFDAASINFGISAIQDNMPEFAIKNNIISPDTQDSYTGIFNSMLNHIPHGSADVKLKTKNGDYRWHHADYSLVYDDNGEPNYALITFFDNTDERELELSAEKWRAGFSSVISESVLSAELNLTKNIVVKVNDDYDKKNNQSISTFEDLIEKGLFGEVDVDTLNEYNNFFTISRLLGLFFENVPNDYFDYCIKTNQDNSIWLRASVDMIKHPHSEDIMAMISFIKLENMKKEFELLTQKALHDSLTGIFNREGLESSANKLFAKYDPKSTTALLLIDLDNFKQINDRLGHQVGDKVLKQVAKVLKLSFHQYDIIGRLGGDEFVILISGNIGLNFLEKKAFELISKISLSLNKMYSLSTSISIGVAYGQGRFTFDRLYGLADISLYTAKRAGKSRFHIINADTNQDQTNNISDDGNDLMSLESLIDFADSNIDNEIKTPYRILLDNIPGEVIIITMGETTTITHCNDWMSNFTGFTLEEVTAQQEIDPFFSLHPEDVPMILDYFHKMKSGLDRLSFNYRVLCKSGEYKNLLLNVVMTERSSNECIFYATNTNADNLLDMENQIEHSRKKIDTLINTIPGALSRIELGNTFEITYFNNWIYEFTGFSKEEFSNFRQGYNLNNFAPNDAVLVRNALNQMKSGSIDKFNLTAQVKHKSGGFKSIIIQGALAFRNADKAIIYQVCIDSELFD